MNRFNHFIHRPFRLRNITGLTAALLLILSLLLLAPVAQADMTIYTDSLQNGWMDWSNPTNAIDWQSTAYVHSGSYAGALIYNPADSLFDVAHLVAGLDITQFSRLDMWINGGATGGQLVGMIPIISGNPQSTFFETLQANTWQHVSVPLIYSGTPDSFVQFLFLTAFSQPVPTFYVDDITLVSVPEPASATVLGVGLLSLWMIRKNRPGRV
jgi:hypothetical protein